MNQNQKAFHDNTYPITFCPCLQKRSFTDLECGEHKGLFCNWYRSFWPSYNLAVFIFMVDLDVGCVLISNLLKSVNRALFSTRLPLTDLDEFPHWYKTLLHTRQPAHPSALSRIRAWQKLKHPSVSHMTRRQWKRSCLVPCHNNQRRLKLYMTDITIKVITLWYSQCGFASNCSISCRSDVMNSWLTLFTNEMRHCGSLLWKVFYKSWWTCLALSLKDRTVADMITALVNASQGKTKTSFIKCSTCHVFKYLLMHGINSYSDNLYKMPHSLCCFNIHPR